MDKHELQQDKPLRQEMLETGLNPLTLWRQKHSLSRVELAALCGVGVNAIEKIESGHYKGISQRLLLALHEKAGVPYEVAALYVLWRNHLGEKARQKIKGQG